MGQKSERKVKEMGEKSQSKGKETKGTKVNEKRKVVKEK